MVRSRFNKVKFLFIFLQIVGKISHADSDTTIIQSRYFASSLSSSYSANANWQGNDFQHFAFATNVIFRDQKTHQRWQHQHILMADLSYLKFVDSIWMKNTDRMQASFLWSEEGAHFRHSYAVNFSTQILPTYSYTYDYETRENIRAKTAYSFCPSVLEMGYGMTKNFWSASNLNFAFATLRLSSLPLNDIQELDRDQQLVIGKKSYYKMEYGLMLSANIQRKLGERVLWLNTSRFFSNALSREQVHLDIQNRINIKLWKYLQLRFETRLSYNPSINYHFQFSQEVMLGLFFEKTK